MATTNPFDVLGDDDSDDPSQLIAAQQQKVVAPKKTLAGAGAGPTTTQPKLNPKMPSKPLPPAQAVRESKGEGRGGSRGGGRGMGRGRGGGDRFSRDFVENENAFSNNEMPGGGYGPTEDRDVRKPFERRGGYGPTEDRDARKPFERRGGYGGSRGSFRGDQRGGFGNGDVGDGDHPRRYFERRSGTGRGNVINREGAGRGNWGTTNDEIVQESEELVVTNDKNLSTEKQSGEEDVVDANKENPLNEMEEKEPEEKEMTLDEYQKVLEEKRKALLALKTEERKVDLDKDLKSMQQLSSKKGNFDNFIKLGSDKDKRKEAEKEEKAKKAVSINEFLKPSEGGKYYSPGGRGRGRGGRGSRGGGFIGGNTMNTTSAPSIEDPREFPTLGIK